MTHRNIIFSCDGKEGNGMSTLAIKIAKESPDEISKI
jgi:hypothetical protein